MSLLSGNEFNSTFIFKDADLSLVYFRQGPFMHFDRVYNELAQKKNNYGLSSINFYVVELTLSLGEKASLNNPPIRLIAPALILFKNHKAFSNITVSDINGIVKSLKDIMTKELGDGYSVFKPPVIPSNQQHFTPPALRTTKKFDHQSTHIYTQNNDYNRELLTGDVEIIPYTVPWKADFR